jgi:hypothetical protein
MKRMTFILLTAAALTGSAAQGGERQGSNRHSKNTPAVKVVGEPVNCLQIPSIRESRVRDDWTIDFRTNNNRWYRNTLANRCNGLGFERTFTYATSLSQVCNVDIITVLSNIGGPGFMPRGSCGLGQFTPVEFVK